MNFLNFYYFEFFLIFKKI